jgi:hypothetical protein
MCIFFTLVFLGAWFTDARQERIDDCNGSVVGKEVGGQFREIWKCSDGKMLII